ELGSGTDPEEGSALAAAVIEHLLKSGCLMIVTTHLSSLKGFAVSDGRVLNASMEFDAGTGRPTYRLIAGVPGRSRAIEAAAVVGLPRDVIERAWQRLGDRYVETDDLLSQLHQKVSEVSAEREEVRRLRDDLERQRKEISEKTAALEKERMRVGRSYREELERLRDDVTRQLATELRNLKEMDRAERASQASQAAAQKVTSSIDRAIDFIPAEQREFHVGDRAEHRSFKVVGDVVSIEGKRAVLSVGGRKMTVELRDLVPAPPPAGGRSVKPKGATAAQTDDSVVVTSELNLIGQRVDDALDESDRFLDRALLEGRQAVRIIHGFGTGALRKAVRDYLRKHPAVKSWRPGGENEGGDGATVVVLE
ncbi:MAG TPA: Smr/MutS family protein, partial [Thermoanaerobaculia bacterium]|nr:Smr/MutS family protein [Thermoanaerobaculia bacterium]